MRVPSSNIQPVLSCYDITNYTTRVEPLGAAGGMSGAQFWRVTTPHGVFALRRWPVEHPSAERLQFIHAVLRHAHAHGCRIVPVPIDDRSGSSYVEHEGHLWELSPWMPGRADYDDCSTPAKLKAALAALASFHVAANDASQQGGLTFAGRPNAVTKRLTRLRELQAGGAEQLARAIDDHVWPEFAVAAREFLTHLPRAQPPVVARLAPLAVVKLPLQPCIRDIWHDHVLFTGDTVTGIIDFGAMDIDTPATDVARLLGSLVGDDAAGWRAALAAYNEVRPLSADELAAVAALDASGTLLAGCNWIRWVYIERRKFENHAQVVARFARLLARAKTL